MVDKNDLAPVAVFVYNRPIHTQNTLNSLAANVLAKHTRVFIYSDGPRDDHCEHDVKYVRSIVSKTKGFRELIIKKEKVNKGLAQSIIDGVTELCRDNGKVIVLEDDLITSPYFLSFMNDALQRYESDDRVMHVSGYLLPVPNPLQIPESFFFRNTTCWGWGTWSRAWLSFNPDAAMLAKEIRIRKQRYLFDINGSSDAYGMLEAQAKGRINSWAIRWYASVFLQGGLCLHPGASLVSNTGHDGTGVHSNETHVYDVKLAEKPIVSFPESVEESSVAVSEIAAFYRNIRGSWLRRLRSKASSILRRLSLTAS